MLISLLIDADECISLLVVPRKFWANLTMMKAGIITILEKKRVRIER